MYFFNISNGFYILIFSFAFKSSKGSSGPDSSEEKSPDSQFMQKSPMPATQESSMPAPSSTPTPGTPHSPRPVSKAAVVQTYVFMINKYFVISNYL